MLPARYDDDDDDDDDVENCSVFEWKGKWKSNWKGQARAPANR